MIMWPRLKSHGTGSSLRDYRAALTPLAASVSWMLALCFALASPATADAQQWPPGPDSASIAAVESDSGTPEATLEELVRSRLANVTVMWPDGLLGTGAQLRVRGVNSLLAPASPTVMIDGMWASNDDVMGLLLDGGAIPVRLDLDPFVIERVELLRGPVAAAMYGSGASAGVLRVTTRRGMAGPARWRVFSEGALAPANLSFPANYAAPGRSTSGSSLSNCFLFQMAAGNCVQDSLISFNPLERRSPFRMSTRQRGGLSVSGGSVRTRYFAGATGERGTGTYRQNDLHRIGAHGNLARSIRPGLDVGVRLGYTRTTVGLPPPDILSSGLYGSPRDDSLGGYFRRTPDQADDAEDASRRTTRLLAGGDVQWRARPWLELSALAGTDRVDLDNDLTKFFTLSGGGSSSGTEHVDLRDRRRTLRAMAVVHANLLTLDSRTELGLDEQRDRRRDASATITRSSLDESSSYYSTGELELPILIRGASLQQRLAFRELALRLGVRYERSEVRDDERYSNLYPAAEIAWTATPARLSRRAPWVSALRLHAGLGDAADYRADDRFLRTFVRTNYSGSGIPPEFGGERTRESEAGASIGVMQDRLRLGALWYSRLTRNSMSLFDQTFGPMTAAGISNSGVETTVSGTVATIGAARWTAALAASTNRNRVTSLDPEPNVALFSGGVTQRLAIGKPLGGFWGRRSIVDDANGDGLISAEEIRFEDATVYLGSPIPTRHASLRTALSLGQRLVIRANLEHVGGHKRLNLVNALRCARRVCRSAFDESTPLADQADVVLLFNQTTLSTRLLEDASATRLRELSLTLTAPTAWARRLAGEQLTFTLSGRDLITWSSYRGLDPEINTDRRREFTSVDEGELPRRPTGVLRIDIAR